jgi:glycosyltransferase involved in cell wall biosynthesis
LEQSLTVVYNGAKHLEDTIRSVINQIYPNVEYIIIDGGSTDGTIDIIKKYEDYIDYWVSEPDKGIYDAMNKGINISFGEWLNMLNSGDSYYNFMVIENIFLKEIDMDIYGIAGNWVCDYKGNIILYLTNPYKILEKPGWHINHQAFFYRKITHKILGLYSIDYRIASDHETVPKIHTVILSEAKNLIFSFQVKKSKKEILRTSSSGQQGKVNLQKF